ncbi:sensor domain-containing diguanylate cyclase [Ideonella livida]|uniref:Diguanylate cyclase n=1 Tax=Ideonella livida TaxID=2707176 RepID=A0A7C9TM76_9BURK|nr:sensor domain-containing diguanylate cyclase [Ideonella livida]NDY93122.1 diguanylate cyclase [Ideonella livida]
MSSSLHARFRRALLLTSAVLVLAMLALVWPLAAEHRRQELNQTVEAAVQAMVPSLAAGAYAFDATVLQELGAGLVRLPAVQAVEVRLVDRTLAPSVQLARPGTDLSLLATPHWTVPLSSPFSATETVGWLQVWMNTGHLEEEVRTEVLRLLLLQALLVATTLAVVQRLARRLLSQPMHQLAERLASAQPGQALGLPLPPEHAHDEIGTVTQSVNQLLQLQLQALQRERALRAEIAAMEQRYRSIFVASAAGQFLLDGEDRLLDANPALARLLGWPEGRQQLAAQGGAVGLLDPTGAGLADLVAAVRQTGQTQSADLPLVAAGRPVFWAHCVLSPLPVEDTDRQRWSVEGALHDITQRKLEEERTRHLADHDTLTGLRSRAFFERHLQHALNQARDRGEPLALLYIDLDGFKAVNDQLGHAAGDQVLVTTAQRLRLIFRRREDLVGRLGGDELVVLLPGLDAHAPEVRQQALQLIEQLRQPVPLTDGRSCQVGASVGAASYPLHAHSPVGLLAAADQAMYVVKQAGKGCFAVAEATLDALTPDTAHAA